MSAIYLFCQVLKFHVGILSWSFVVVKKKNLYYTLARKTLLWLKRWLTLAVRPSDCLLWGTYMQPPPPSMLQFTVYKRSLNNLKTVGYSKYIFVTLSLILIASHCMFQVIWAFPQLYCRSNSIGSTQVLFIPNQKLASALLPAILPSENINAIWCGGEGPSTATWWDPCDLCVTSGIQWDWENPRDLEIS